MGITGNELVTVLGFTDEYKKATVKLKNLDGFYWADTGKDEGAHILHGFMYHNKAEGGELGCGCICGCYPHIVEVWVPEDLNKDLFTYMAKIAGENSGQIKGLEVIEELASSKEDRLAIFALEGIPTSSAIREIVKLKPGITAKEVENILVSEGLEKRTVKSSIKYLKASDFKTLPKLKSEIYNGTQKLYLDYSYCNKSS